MSTWQAAAFRVRHSRWQLRVRRVGLGCCVEHARVVVDPASGHVTVVRLSTTPFGRPMAASTFYDGLELRLIASRRDLTDGQLMRFRLVVRNHNDHEYWYWYICAPSLDIPITIDVDPRAGRQWTGRLGELKRRLLTQDGGRIRISAGGDIGGGDCAEPSLYSIAAHGTIIRDFAWRPFSVGPGERNVTATGELALAGASAVAVHPFETTHEMQTSLVLRVAPGRNDYLAPAALVDRLLADERISTVVRGIPVGDWRDAWLGIYRGTWTFGLEWREKNASGHYAFHHIEATLDAIDGSISHIYRY